MSENTLSIVLSLLFFVLLRYLEEAIKRYLLSNNDVDAQTRLLKIEIEYLRNQSTVQEKKHAEEIEKLRKEYMHEIAKAEAYARYLMDEIQKLKGSIRPEPVTTSDRLLLVCAAGQDSSICREDENAIIRAHMPYTRIINASLGLLSQEMQRRRFDGSIPKYMQLSGHAGANGFIFGAVTVSTYELTPVIQGVDTILLAGCSDVTVADHLIGAVRAVVSVREDVYSLDMANFTYSFWRAVVAGKSTSEAYEIAQLEVPAVAPFADYREETKIVH